MYFGVGSDFVSDPLTRSAIPDLPSIGKDLNKMHQQSFYNPSAVTNGGIGGHHDVIGSAGASGSGVGIHL
jgi:hypothetical protein